MSGTLYVVASPLGNLGDLSERAAETLRAVDLVAAEDTRRTRTLLAHIGARPRVLSYHAHSPAERPRRILSALAEGASVALVTDAGTPAVSDPGAGLVAAAHAAGIAVVAIPGPSAVPTALSVSGLTANRYTFLGFLPRRGPDRRELLETAAGSPWTVVLFESARRLPRLLEDLAACAGPERSAAVARELTKLHEDVKTGTLHDLAVYYGEHEARGEVTVVLAGCGPREPAHPDIAAARNRARALLADGVSRRDAAARLASETYLSRNEAYRVVSEL
ncbi:MAG: 16S rRNA (cytidine(1402)-2'-O)-methyltransferase [Gemmatimonadetes bacterium]|nr:16S rRNA (cytidine(1402)-2'-O)-methyltransferase [Gemmatimonadota bacterium]